MVQFNKLRLSGFKSFVDTTELHIESGMTGIVGPNGCGKSNLVEALRWVMGETSAKRMRGSEMDDVIFAGSATRPARNLAEVALVLDNTSRTAPAAFNEFEEIEVVRRITRGSGSAYKVNGRDVRARDVQLLFADASSGSQSTSLVSQGRVGEIINARPTNRRVLLEEAAGITGLHSRRHEAELRLKAAETNLERLEDVITTLESQLQALKKQARQATRYRNLAQLIRQNEAILLHYESVDAQQALSEAKEQLKACESVVAEHTQRTAGCAKTQADIAATLPGLREAESEAAQRLQRLLVDQENLEREEQQAQTALAQAKDLLEQLTKDRERAQGIDRDAREAEQRLTAEREEIRQQEKAAREEREPLEQRCRDGARGVAETDKRLNEISARVAADEARATALARRLQELEGNVKRLEVQRANQQETKSKLEAQRGSGPSLSEAENAVQLAEEALAQAREKAESAEVTLQSRRNEEDTLREKLQEAQTRENQIGAEVAALSKLLAQDSSAAEHPVLEDLEVSPGYEKALGAALGDDLNAGTVEEAEVFWRRLEDTQGLPPLPGGTTPLRDKVKGPDALQRRLSQIGVIEESAQGDTLQSALLPGQRLVSHDGALWRWDGFTSRPDAPSQAAVRLEQKNRLRELRKDLTAAEQETTRARQSFEERKAAREQAAREEKEARQAVNHNYNALSNARKRHSDLAQQDARLASQISAAEESLTRRSEELKAAQTQLRETKDEQNALPDLQQEKARIAELRDELSRQRQKLSADRSRQDQLKRDAESRARRLQSIEEELASWKRRTEEATRYLSDLDGRITRTTAEINVWQERPQELQRQRSALATLVERAEAERKAAADRLREAEIKQAEADRLLKQAEHEQAQAREAMIRAESGVTQAKQTLGVVIDKVRDKLGCSLEKALSIAEVDLSKELPEREEVARKHERLCRERDNMGPVNLRAEKEAEELEARIEGMNSDREDLLAAISRLRQGISNLNREGRERLLKAFERVNAHFSDLFVRLFGGGRAHLTLTEAEDPLQAGLEIMASPPGKRLQVMSLLSGGEQALTALSLLFAVFLTNPAPICVLDEVDAPLDDANVDRFCKLLEELVHSTSTRFLIISHHRMTMARVHRLFGVTMSERGVSQLVSVDLEAADELVENT